MSTISAGNTTTTAIRITGDTTGNLVFTTSGSNTVALTLSNTQSIILGGPLQFADGSIANSTGAISITLQQSYGGF